ncbi:unnamed protein product [Linum trigynum]|uniref:Uncharacterized protein n=1 Tax=Linum trigynum TaxID=586398 RepID=A0AAV2E598_9ROSI
MENHGDAPEQAADGGLVTVTRATVIFLAKQSRRVNELARTTGEESKLVDGAHTISTTPELFEDAPAEANVPEFEESDRVRMPLFVKEEDDKNPLIGRENQLESSQFCAADSFMGIQGTCRMYQFNSNMVGLKNTKFDFENLGLNSGDGGKGSMVYSKAMATIRGWGRMQKFNWKLSPGLASTNWSGSP